MPTVTSPARPLAPAVWTARAAAHAARADALTAARRRRRSHHEKDAVEDFLFEYYPVRPAQLARWHPGVGVTLESAGAEPAALEELERRTTWRWHAVTPSGQDVGEDSVHQARRILTDPPTTSAGPPPTSAGPRPADPPLTSAGPGPAGLDVASTGPRTASDGPAGPTVTLDVAAFMTDRGAGVRWLHNLLGRTAARPAQLGCLGLHEWAMVYRQDEHRHELPLRLGQAGTDAVVEAHPIRCTHFDAFRFFTAPARPLNRLQPERATRPDLEQPGCLHANMDLLKAALKLGPACPGELLLDCFELARDIRVLDMQASPYDVTSLGHAPVAIETAAGRAEYVARQRGFADRADPLRTRLTEVTTTLLAHEPTDGATAA